LNRMADAAWKTFTPEKLAEIEKAREAVRAAGGVTVDAKGTYGIVCRACTKPNSVHVPFCTGCSFPATKEDIQKLPDNVFLAIVNGSDSGTPVLYRDEEMLVFNDKFGVSSNHIDVIPIKVIDDITSLTKDHVGLLERMYECGKKLLMARNIPWLQGQNIDDFISAGYNYPVSVKHLHVHLIMPPYTHNKILQYPRWHSHAKVVNDLKTHGAAQLYNKTPNDAEGKAVYDRAMAAQDKARELIAIHGGGGATPTAAGTSSPAAVSPAGAAERGSPADAAARGAPPAASTVRVQAQ